MQHTVKEAVKLYNTYNRDGVIQRKMISGSEWEEVKDFNEDYVLDEEYEYRVQQYFRLPTSDEFNSLGQAFAKVDNNNNDDDLKLRIFLDEKSGNKLHFHLNEIWCSDDIENGYVKCFNGFFVMSVNNINPRGVRLVADEPFEGGIKFGNVWWKPENEEGLYTWEAAKKRFG